MLGREVVQQEVEPRACIYDMPLVALVEHHNERLARNILLDGGHIRHHPPHTRLIGNEETIAPAVAIWQEGNGVPEYFVSVTITNL